MKLSEAIVSRIKGLCDERNITYNKLATICGVTQSTIDYILKNPNSKTTVSSIKKICDGLDMTLSDFFNTDEFNGLEQEIK